MILWEEYCKAHFCIKVGVVKNMTEEVNEFLKTCRLYYRMLVTVCVASLMFAIAPYDTQRFQQAIQEAELVSEMDFARLINKGVMDHNEVGAYIEKITAIMSAEDITYEELAYQTLFGELFSLPRNATIDELQKYIRQIQSGAFVVPQVDDLWFNEVKQKIAELNSHPKILKRMQFGIPRTQLNWKDGIQKEINIPNCGTKKIEVEVNLIEVIQKDPKNGQLVQIRKDNQMIIFPRLRAFWQEVRDLRPRDAVSHLAVRKAYTIDNIAFLGLSIPAYLAVIVVPSAIFIILLHLYLYMRILSKLMSKEDTSHKQIGFAWLPLFTDPASQILTFIYNPLLPIIANILILQRSISREYIWLSLIAILVTLAAAILGLLLYAQKTRKLHLLA